MKGPASFSVVLGDFRCDVTRQACREIQASSGNSDSANWPGYEAVKGLAKQESVRKCPRSFLDQNLFHSVAYFPPARRIMVHFQRMSEAWFSYGAAAWLAQLGDCAPVCSDKDEKLTVGPVSQHFH